MSFTIELYSFSGENELVDKTSKLSGVVSLTGDLREATNVFNPVIKINHNNPISANYLKISEFNKYYYINDIVCVQKDIWEIYCTEDVLMTFKEEIYNQNAIINKQKEDHINKFFNDGTYASQEQTFSIIKEFDIDLFELGFLYLITAYGGYPN